MVLEAETVVGHILSSKMRENSSDGTSCGGLSQKHVGNEAKWHAQKARKMAEAAQVDRAQMLRWLGPQVGSLLMCVMSFECVNVLDKLDCAMVVSICPGFVCLSRVSLVTATHIRFVIIIAPKIIFHNRYENIQGGNCNSK